MAHGALPAATRLKLSQTVSDSVDTRQQIEQMRADAAYKARLAAQRDADDEFHRRH